MNAHLSFLHGLSYPGNRHEHILKSPTSGMIMVFVCQLVTMTLGKLADVVISKILLAPETWTKKMLLYLTFDI